MKKLLLTLIALWISALMLNPNTAQAQCGCAENFETTFPEAVKAAPVVIEGQITSDFIEFGGEYNDSYKSSKITVYKVLKGDINATEVELIEYNNLLVSTRCNEGAGIGVFILYPSDVTTTPRPEIALQHKFKYKIMLGIGCNTVSYNATDNKGIENYLESPYGIYNEKDIEKKVYRTVEQITAKKYIEVAPLPKKDFGGSYIANAKSKNGEKQAINIANISTTTIKAGIFDTLTITGSGFTSDLTVGFRNSEIYEEKYISIPDNHIVYRDSTTFRVLVPCVQLNKNVNYPADGNIIIAGSGKVAIMKEGSVKKKSSQTLTIPYAESTYARSDTSSLIYPVRLARNTPNGDFTFWLHNTVRGNNPILKNKLYSLNA